jgi:transposase
MDIKPKKARRGTRAEPAVIDPYLSTVTMLDLDKHMSRILAQARTRPISVYRYGAPYVWILPHEVWLGSAKLDDFIPNRHPLTLLDSVVARELQGHANLLRRIGLRLRLQISAESLLRALMLQAAYSLPTEGALHDQLRCNLAFRWFVGLSLNAPVWEAAEFVKEVRLLLGSDDAVELLQDVLQICLPVLQRIDVDFRLNSALVRAWALRHPRLEKRVPSKAWHEERLFLAPG